LGTFDANFHAMGAFSIFRTATKIDSWKPGNHTGNIIYTILSILFGLIIVALAGHRADRTVYMFFFLPEMTYHLGELGAWQAEVALGQ